MKTLEQALLDKIYYIGNELPANTQNDKRPKFVVLGTPGELIKEVGTTKDKSEFDTACWIAEYAYKMANPESRFGEPPSMVYEQVARDYSKFLVS